MESGKKHILRGTLKILKDPGNQEENRFHDNEDEDYKESDDKEYPEISLELLATNKLIFGRDDGSRKVGLDKYPLPGKDLEIYHCQLSVDREGKMWIMPFRKADVLLCRTPLTKKELLFDTNILEFGGYEMQYFAPSEKEL